MSHNLTQNEWGFSVLNDNPFAIFRFLQKIAKESVGEDNIIDLSRGDPGYGFTPSARGRRFFSFLLELDAFFNSDNKRFYTENRDLKAETVNFAKSIYEEKKGKELLDDLEEFVDVIIHSAKSCGLDWTISDVFKRLFGQCALSGGSYLNPQGEEIVRVFLADWYRRFINEEMDHEDFVLFNGASHAIGTFFRVMGKEGLKLLNEDSLVVICSPSYSPYNTSLINRNIRTFTLPIDYLSGEFDSEALLHLENLDERVAAFILIDPNNPTGLSLESRYLQKLADLARKFDAIIVSDEVYSSFFPKKKTIVDFCPERVLRIDARSKVERSTGLRFGDMFINKKANAYLTELLKKSGGVMEHDLKEYIIKAKGPGGVEGEFLHTTFVSGPSQFLGLCHMVLGEAEREKYFLDVQNNGKIFAETLGLPNKKNLYYLIFDLNEVAIGNKKETPVEKKLLDLAKMGVIYLPTYLFFSEKKRTKDAVINMVRVSVVNTEYSKVKKAAEITKTYLTS
jgi:aspartate/methionine/tyrosine aminotransferase